MKRIAKEIGMIILMLVLGEVLFNFLYLTGTFYEHEHLSTYNSNAKLAFTNTATIITKYEARGGDPCALDGAYWGSLYCRECPQQWQDIDMDSRENAFDFDHALKYYMGSSDREWAGYYFVLIRDGIPEQCYWSRTDELLYYAERFAKRAKANKLGADVYNGGEKLGGFRVEMTTVVKESPEWLELTDADIIRRARRVFVKKLPEYCVLLFPLFVYVCLRLVGWSVRKIKGKKALQG